MKKRIWLLLILSLLLAGCAVPTVDQLYCVPARPQSYSDMQSVFDRAMAGLDYTAPKNGENLQTIQMADLDGDGVREYLIFARSDSDKSLKILIFGQVGESYTLTDSVKCSGASFDQVEYIQMDGKGGTELLVGTRISEQLYRSAVVYRYEAGHTSQIMSTSYVKFLTCDMNGNGQQELLVLKPGLTDQDPGTAALCWVEAEMGKRSNEVPLSCPVAHVERIFAGTLADGKQGIFISGEDGAPVTDVLALDGQTLRNAALESATGTATENLGEYRLYPMDLDEDGVVEMPQVLKARDPKGASNQRIVRWYALDAQGKETEKGCTWHDVAGGWYLHLEDSWVANLRISTEPGVARFHQVNPETGTVEEIFSVHVLTGQNREANAVIENRFILHKGEQVIYAARLEVASGALSISREDLISRFRLDNQAWKS